MGLIPESGRSPGEENGNPLQYSGLENTGQRSLAGNSPWGRAEQARLSDSACTPDALNLVCFAWLCLPFGSSVPPGPDGPQYQVPH